MKTSGIIFVSMGVILFFVSLSMDIGVSVNGSSDSYDKVANISLMQTQTNLLTTASVLFISGIIAIGFGNISEKLAYYFDSEYEKDENRNDEEINEDEIAKKT